MSRKRKIPVPLFVPLDGLELAVSVIPGHEHLVEGKNDYGIRHDDWVFAVRDAECVALLTVSSNVICGRLDMWSARRVAQDTEYTEGDPPHVIRYGDLSFCTSFPTEAEAIGGVGTECVYQVGSRHFGFLCSMLQSEPMILGLDRTFMEGPPDWWTGSLEVVRAKLFEREDVWTPLKARFFEQRERALKARAAIDGVALCSCCAGSGLVRNGKPWKAEEP